MASAVPYHDLSQRWRSLVQQHQDKGLSFSQAAARVDRDCPGLRQAMCQQQTEESAAIRDLPRLHRHQRQALHSARAGGAGSSFADRAAARAAEARAAIQGASQ